MKHFWFLLILLGSVQHALPECSCAVSEFKLHGKYLLGGLFDIHNVNVSVIHNRPVALECTKQHFSLSSYRMFQVMRFAVQEINNSTLILPNVSLGYDIFDYCSDVLSFPAILDLMSINGSIEVQDHASDYFSKIISVLGPFGSTESLTVVPLFTHNLIPMVNYGSASSVLSDNVKYPTFLRTIPSNKDIIHLIVSILQHFDWRWVAFMTGSDAYSKDGAELFKRQIQETEICLAYEQQMNAEAIVQSAIRYNMRNKVWIAGDAWSLDKNLLNLNGIQSIGTIIGVTGTTFFTLSKFYDFVNSSHEQRAQCGACGSGSFEHISCGQECEACIGVSADDLIQETPSYNFPVYAAVYAVAHALHNVLQCGSEGCQDNITVHPSMVLKELKKSNFTLLNRTIQFDKNGDPKSASYRIVFWKSGQIVMVGSYETHPTVQLVVNSAEIQWHANGTVPVSLCSAKCHEGYKQRQVGDHKCCFSCEICPSGTYVNSTVEPDTCIECKDTEWSDPGSTICLERTVEYIRFTDSIAIFIMILTSFMLAQLLAVAILFARNYNTPVVKSAGGPMCFLVLGNLGVSSTSVFFFIGEATEIRCVLRILPFFLSYSCCLACFAVRTFQIVYVFKMAAKFPEMYKLWVKHNGQALVVAMVFVTQAALLTIWLVVGPPKPYNDTSAYKDQIVIKCDSGNYAAQGICATVLAVLCGLCFLFSYIGKDLPKNYNEAKAITFCLLLLIFTWITFITISMLYYGKDIQTLNAMAVLSSLYCFLLWYFLPKCYIIIFQPQKNTQQHFQGLIQKYTQNISQ